MRSRAEASLEKMARRTLLQRWRSLLARREETEHEAQALYEEHEPDWEDRASLVVQASGLEQLGDNQRAQLVQVTAALERLDDGTWGWCLGCGKPIDRERLRAVPEAARCVGCSNHH
jgi:RNA polymerase-binding protein DksA